MRFLLFFITFLYAGEIGFEALSLKMDYKEFVRGCVIDKDTSQFADMRGVSINYKDEGYLVKVDFVRGESLYDGMLNTGEKIKIRQKNVYIVNALIEGKIGFLNLRSGFRFWNRGESGESYDYNEQYYWYYVGVGSGYEYKVENFEFSPKFWFDVAIKPSLKVYLGNNPTLDLGFTRGYGIELPFYIVLSDTLKIGLTYKYSHWHISKSDYENLVLNGNTYQIFEPESITNNQYIGVGIRFAF